MSRFLIPLSLVGLLASTACSYQQLYDSAHASARNECIKRAGATALDCLERSEERYDDYVKQRDTLSNSPAQ